MKIYRIRAWFGRLVCIGLFVVFLLAPDFSSPQTLGFRHYSIDDGLPASTVYHVCQDHLGFIWIATGNGVARFDGNHFQTFSKHDGLSDNTVLRIFEDSKHQLWFLTYNGDPCIWNGRKFLNADNDPLLKKIQNVGTTVSFLEDNRHHIWLSGRNFMYEINPEKNSVKNYYLKKGYFCYPFQASSGEIWLARSDSFSVLKNGKFISRKMKYQPIDVRMIFPLSNSSFYFSSIEGIVEMTDTSQQLIYAHTDTSRYYNHSFSLAFQDRAAHWWDMINGDKNIFYKNSFSDSDQFLNGVNFSSATIDRDGNLWLPSLNDGLYMLPAGVENVVQMNQSSGLFSDKITSVAVNGNDIWLGFIGGTVNVCRQKKIETIDLKNVIGSRYGIDQFIFEGTDVLCTNTGLIAWFSKKDPQHIGRRLYRTGYSAIHQPTFVKFIRGENGNLYGLTSYYIYQVERRNGTYELMPLDTTFLEAKAFFADENGKFIIATRNGIETLFNGHKDSFPFPDSLQGTVVSDIDRLDDSSLIFSTVTEGLFIVRNFKVMQVINASNGLSSNACLKTFARGDLVWILTQSGIDCFHYHQNQFILLKHYSKDDGLLSNQVQDFTISGGSLYAATLNGLSIIPVDLEEKKEPAPVVYLTGFIQNKINYLPQIDSSSKILKSHFEYSQHDFNVKFTAPYFKKPHSVKYEYRLNEKEQWKPAESNEILLSGLAPGHYQFEVRAKTFYSDWSKSALISFEITAPFWQRDWFIVAVTLLVAATVFLFYRSRLRLIYRKRSEQLAIQNNIMQLEQQALKAMMNPHFIYNVMNSIQQFINTNEKEAANNYLSNFARLIRSNMEISARSFISIEDELELLQNYLSLEQLRFGSEMQFNIEVDEKLDPDETMIPSMIVQPLVENAIWHGLMPFSGDGFIGVYFKILDAQFYTVEISDNGIGMNQSKQPAIGKNAPHKSRGVSFIQQRLNLLSQSTGKPHTISMQPLHPEENERPGTKVIVTIPLVVHD